MLELFTVHVSTWRLIYRLWLKNSSITSNSSSNAVTISSALAMFLDSAKFQIPLKKNNTGSQHNGTSEQHNWSRSAHLYCSCRRRCSAPAAAVRWCKAFRCWGWRTAEERLFGAPSCRVCRPQVRCCWFSPAPVTKTTRIPFPPKHGDTRLDFVRSSNLVWLLHKILVSWWPTAFLPAGLPAANYFP